MKNTELKKQVGETIQHEREKKGLTRKQASSYISMDENSFRRIEQGQTNVTVGTIERVFKGLGKKAKIIVDSADNH